jgi:hypothetical protein
MLSKDALLAHSNWQAAPYSSSPTWLRYDVIAGPKPGKMTRGNRCPEIQANGRWFDDVFILGRDFRLRGHQPKLSKEQRE